MKLLVVLGGCVIGVLITLYPPVTDQLIGFIAVGQIPLTNFTIPAMGMLAFWVFIVPIVLLTYRIVVGGFWQTIEMIGRISQRQINRSVRWSVENSPLLPLLSIVLLQLLIERARSTSASSKSTSRRRLVVLPA